MYLDKDDLINMVKGISPYYTVFNNPLVKLSGNYVGGFTEKWEWDIVKLDNLSETKLIELYNICKGSWV